MSKFSLFGTLALALVLGGSPSLVLAQETNEAKAVEVRAEVTAEKVPAPEVRPISATQAREMLLKQQELLKEKAMNVREALEERKQEILDQAEKTLEVKDDSDEQGKDDAVRAREASLVEQKKRMEAAREEAKEDIADLREQKQQFDAVRERVKIFLEEDRQIPVAGSLVELKRNLEERRAELRENLASSSPREAEALARASEVSVAVHALLSARDLLGEKGGIGDKVSEIARQVNDSLATTTAAEARVDSRGFLRKLFFGGDKEVAQTLKTQVDENKEKVGEIRDLLKAADTTEEVKAELEAQLEAMRAEQERLRSVADSESRRWGLFSWRIFGN